jgi:hypothetical protein
MMRTCQTKAIQQSIYHHNCIYIYSGTHFLLLLASKDRSTRSHGTSPNSRANKQASMNGGGGRDQEDAWLYEDHRAESVHQKPKILTTMTLNSSLPRLQQHVLAQFFSLSLAERVLLLLLPLIISISMGNVFRLLWRSLIPWYSLTAVYK